MTVKSEILRLFEESDGVFSGQDIARRLNVSRTAVWKAIKSLKTDGYDIQASTNRGYRLVKSGDLLSEESINALLSDMETKPYILVYETVDSTNTLAKKLAVDGAPSGTVIVAEEQTAGRGRRGNSFFSPKKTGLYMSVIIRPKSDVSDLPLYTVCAANAVCSAVEAVSDCKPQIKWVNDIFLGGKKICGILTEATGNFETHMPDSVIIGIGVNLSTEIFPEEISSIAGSLNAGTGRAKICAEIIRRLMSVLSVCNEENIAFYRAHSLVIGRQIGFTRNGEQYEALAEDIDESGHLVVRLENGDRINLDSGEISVKLK